MPVSVSKIQEEEQPRYRERILAFLNEHPGVAYSVEELMDQIGFTHEQSLRTRLSVMTKRGLVVRHLATDEEGRRRYYYTVEEG